jgi:hypothetical protein
MPRKPKRNPPGHSAAGSLTIWPGEDGWAHLTRLRQLVGEAQSGHEIPSLGELVREAVRLYLKGVLATRANFKSDADPLTREYFALCAAEVYDQPARTDAGTILPSADYDPALRRPRAGQRKDGES